MSSAGIRSSFFALLLAGAACGGSRPAPTPPPGSATPLASATVVTASPLSESEQSLLQACAQGQADSVKFLLAKGVNVNARDKDGREPIIEATYWQHADIVRLLIDKGANVNAKKADGTTALDFAISFRNKPIEEMLRKAGAKSDKEVVAEPGKKAAAAGSASPAATTKK